MQPRTYSFTPPVPSGYRLKVAHGYWPFSDSINDIKENTVILTKDGGYNGIYTGDIQSAIAVTIIEKDVNNNIDTLIMDPCASVTTEDFGEGSCNFEPLMEFLALRKLPTGYYRECIISVGRNAALRGDTEHKTADEFRKYISTKSSLDLDTFFTQEKYINLAFRQLHYTFNPVRGTTGSVCVTFDGHIGLFYQNTSSEGKEEVVVEKPDLKLEKAEFENIRAHYNNSSEIKKVIEALENVSCEKTGTALYFATREFIYETQFLTNNEEKQKKFNAYKLKVNNYLPLCSDKQILFTAVSCLIGIGFVSTLPYLFYKVYQQNKKRSSVKETVNNFQKKM